MKRKIAKFAKIAKLQNCLDKYRAKLHKGHLLVRLDMSSFDRWSRDLFSKKDILCFKSSQFGHNALFVIVCDKPKKSRCF